MEKDILMHYGTPRHSGRYPWGSGDNPYQHTNTFLNRVNELKDKGLTEKEIAAALGMSTTELRTQKSLANHEKRALDVETARSLREHGYSLSDIAEKIGLPGESSVRSLLNENSERRMKLAKATAEILKKELEDTGMVDVGAGVERQLGVSREKLNEALKILEEEGYPVYGGGIPQVTNPGKQSNRKVLCVPGTEHKDIYEFDKVKVINDYHSDDDGETFRPTFEYPESLSSKRLAIRYAEDGGVEKDGLIELRPGVEDISLGNSHYAQVRILVDGTHYLKGMAVYNDDLPDGVDVLFNTNKKKGTPPLGEEKGNTVLKKISSDPDNPFGSLIKENGQRHYEDENGNLRLSVINKRADEGDWNEWSDHLPSQFLSKQNINLINRQLGLAKADKLSEFEEICSLTNPTIKRELLGSFAEDCDSAAVHLQAAALPRQKYQVILPLTSIKDNEVYAPNYKDGETVALIRYPHGGTFEIPICKVNNKNKEGRKIISTDSKDAIGINAKVAERLSGADFDGDTVMVIPTGGKTKITSTPALEGLKGFDPKLEYGGKAEGTYKKMKNTQTEMGKISNLITDMTLKGATEPELARAVRHSMVVIDAEKHGLDYKQSERDNGIAALKKKYQGETDSNGKYHEGASTIISRAKSETSVSKRTGQPWINKDTGELEYERINPKTGEYETKIKNESYVDKKTGKTVTRTQKSTKMAETKDAYSLVSEYRAPAELAYADYANYMKALANNARKEMVSTERLKYDPSAKKVYSDEVKSLNNKLDEALKNAPRERQAQSIANSVVNVKKKEAESKGDKLTKAEIKKISQQALSKARVSVGAKRKEIEITDKEWEAIQAGAISDNKLAQMLKRTDIDKLRERAMPRQSKQLSDAKVAKLKAMSQSGYTNEQIATTLGVSTSTVIKYMK